LCLLTLLPSPAGAASGCRVTSFDETAIVDVIHDGDTVRLRDGRKVRLIGINTPELARDDMAEQPLAREARETLHAAVAAHEYRIGMVYGRERHDRYKRTLAHLFTPEGDNLQALLLRQGLATAIPHPPNLSFSDCYNRQEQTARCNHDGIWSDNAQLVVQASTLNMKHKGFHLVTGIIEQIKLYDRGIRINMGKLMLGISKDNLAEFDLSALQALRGKRVTVRGWIQPRRAKQQKTNTSREKTAGYYMHIRHPSAIEINQTENDLKCQRTIDN